jgi:hypothetical protein
MNEPDYLPLSLYLSRAAELKKSARMAISPLLRDQLNAKAERFLRVARMLSWVPGRLG